jgi:hypothetical protein
MFTGLRSQHTLLFRYVQVKNKMLNKLSMGIFNMFIFYKINVRIVIQKTSNMYPVADPKNDHF